MEPIKQELYNYCRQFVKDRLDRIQERMENIQESLTSETKSSAGDKHETGRAMLQLEREKAGVQLFEAKKLHQILEKTDISHHHTIARLGSIVETSQGSYFLSISVGKIELRNKSYFAIATNTPIGELLLGKKNGDYFIFNTTKYIISDIL